MMMQIIKAMIVAAAVSLTACGATKQVQTVDVETHNLIIFYEPGAGNEALLKAAKDYGSEILYVYNNFNGIAVTVPAGKKVKDAMKYYGKVKGVLSVSEDRKMQLDDQTEGLQ